MNQQQYTWFFEELDRRHIQLEVLRHAMQRIVEQLSHHPDNGYELLTHLRQTTADMRHCSREIEMLTEELRVYRAAPTSTPSK